MVVTGKERGNYQLIKNKMNKTQKIVIAIIVAGLLIGGGIWLGTKKEKMVTIPLDKTEISTNIMKDSYMEGCMGEDSTSYALCNCTYNSLINNYGKEKVIELSVDYLNTEEIPADILKKVMDDCL